MQRLKYLTIVVVCYWFGLSRGTFLDDYVWKDDGMYSYKLVPDWTYKAPGRTSYMINMTSQRYLSDAKVDKSVWWHFLVVHVPDQIDPDLKSSGYLFIDGDGNDNPEQLPDISDPFIAITGIIADITKSVVANIKQVPNQNIRYYDDPKNKSRDENAILAYSWHHFIDHPDEPEYLPEVAMTKAAVKGMDTVTHFVNATFGNVITDYCVGGASKRGWTTWLTGVVDYKRVKCITPIVYDYLNFVPNLHHHYRAYGGWSFAMQDFYDEGIMEELDNPNMVKMAQITDPFSYANRLTIPKWISSSGGDEWFLPDDSHYYLTSMKGPTYINMLPNAEHTCVGHEMQVAFNIQAFYMSIMKGFTLPKVSWTLYNTATGGGIEVVVDTQPILIRAWSSVTVSNTRRDFRLLIANASNTRGDPVPQANIWHAYDVVESGDMKYVVHFDSPLDGHWRAFFVQMTFPGPQGTVFETTTETKIIPNKFPFPDCHMESCKGTIV